MNQAAKKPRIATQGALAEPGRGLDVRFTTKITADNNYTRALTRYRKFLEKEGAVVRAYKAEYTKIASDTSLTMMQKQKLLTDLRNSGKYKEAMDKEVAHVAACKLARKMCFRPEDHPLFTDPNEATPTNLKMLDEKNYDRAAAHTLEEKAAVEANIEELATIEAYEAADREERERKRAESEREYRALGDTSFENVDTCVVCGRMGFHGKIKHSERCPIVTGSQEFSPAIQTTAEGIDLLPEGVSMEELAESQEKSI